MWNDTACTHPAHSWQSAVEWGTFQRQGELFRREKRRTVRCLHCRQIKRSKITEWESYGSQNFHGSLADSLPELLLPAARQLLRELHQAGNNKRWVRWKLKSQACHPHFMDAVDELYRRGVMIKREAKDPTRTVATRLLQVTYHPGHLPAIEQLLGVQHTVVPEWLAEVKPLPPTAASPLTGQGRRILALLQQQQALLDHGGPADLTDAAGVVVTTSSYKKTYAKMIRALQGLYQLAEEQRTESWKTFSQLLFHHTKELNAADRRKLERILGQDLTAFGIAPTSDTVLLTAACRWAFDGGEADSRALGAYLSLSHPVIQHMELLAWTAPKLLLIENKDLFQNVVQRRALHPQEWAVMFGGGYVSSAEIELLGKAEAQGLQQLYIWPDLDPYGYQIALNVKERLARRGSGLRLYVFGFHREWLAQSAVAAELSSVDREWIARLLQGPLPPSVRETLVDMQVAGRKAEQEMWIHEIGPKGFGARVEQESILL